MLMILAVSATCVAAYVIGWRRGYKSGKQPRRRRTD